MYIQYVLYIQFQLGYPVFYIRLGTIKSTEFCLLPLLYYSPTLPLLTSLVDKNLLKRAKRDIVRQKAKRKILRQKVRE